MNFYIFALQWNHLINTHTIHGLWPQYSEHKWPQYCNVSDKFNIQSISDMILTLNKIWPSIDYTNNINFWKHEWYRHGTCNFNHLEQHDYFKTIVELYYIYPINKCHNYTNCNLHVDTKFNFI